MGYINNKGHGGYQRNGNPARDVDDKIATAPYNFVSLPYEGDDPKTYKTLSTKAVSDEGKDLYSGTITCTLKALTPIMVAGPSDRNEKNGVRKFLEVDNQKIIQGSSIKGMFRSYIEAFSCSVMHPVIDSYIYWRNVTGKGSGVYKDSFEEDPTGGFLKKAGARYKFYKAKKITRLPEYDKDSYRTGRIAKKNQGYYFGEPSGEGEFLDDEIVNRFLNEVNSNTSQKDIWRKEKEKLDRNEFARVFCIYYKDGERKGQVKELGVARYLRIPYPQTPAQMAGEFNSDDFCAQLFGYVDAKNKNQKAKKGKLSFSECRLNNAKELGVKSLILGGPHPTCVQHYVDQWVDEGNVPSRYKKKNDADQLEAYQKGNALRGRKFYWHRKTQLQNTNTENKDVVTNFIPVDKGAEGTFRITLNSVNEFELGAILELLNLPDNSACKMGMAKPYGYGSVKITVQKFDLQKDSSRYNSITQRLSNTDNSISEKDRENLIDNFEKYVCESIYPGEGYSYEEIQSIADLREMMLIQDGSCNRLENSDWAQRTAYMASPTDKNAQPSFRHKKILPYPDHVKKYK